MNKVQAAIIALVEAVRQFTSLREFRSGSPERFNEHIEYRAHLYRAMCAALIEHQKAASEADRQQTESRQT